MVSDPPTKPSTTPNKPLSGADASKKESSKPRVEDKPFKTFINDHFIPLLHESLVSAGQKPTALELKEGQRPVVGGNCWMVYGQLPQNRAFWLCFSSETITSMKTIAISEKGSPPSLLESFLIDEKKITLVLLLSRLLQRLNGQKWLGAN